MADDLLTFVACALAIYNMVPTVLTRICSIGAISRLSVKDRVIITFDDGPDPRYTPRVLEILNSAGVKACFFVVGEKARRYPDLIKKITSEGHDIGCHGFRHRIPWLLGPVGTILELMESYRAIEEIAGRPPAAFRPPWGLLNLSHYITWVLFKHRIVLWSFMSWDWCRGMTSENMLKKVKNSVIDGSILVFHDSDTEPGAFSGSPEKMIRALPEIINELKKRGYKITPLKDFLQNRGTVAGYLGMIWRKWESVFRLLFRVYDVTAPDGGPTIFRTSLRRYPGPPVELPCGGMLRTGEKVCDLHLNNEYISEYLRGETDAATIGVKIVREMRRSLPALAGHIKNDPRFKSVEFLMGVSILHRGSMAMGFTPVNIQSTFIKKAVAIYQGMVLKVYHPAGKRTPGQGDLSPKIIVMSKLTLFSKHLKNHPCD
ncbi:MAG: polysaccharide deacetylase family protein [Bacillota bacterium]